MTVLPFLRTPPFPGISPVLAAVSIATAQDEHDAIISDAVADMLVQARVGGSFWGCRPDGIRLVLRAGMRIAADRLARYSPDEIGIVDDSSGQTRHGTIRGRRLPWSCDPWALLRDATSVHAHPNDEIAIVAGLIGIPVFGPDLAPVPPAILRHAAHKVLRSARYRNCFTGEMAEVEEVISLLADWRRHLDGVQGIAAASGIALWKRDAIRRFLWDGEHIPAFLPPKRGLLRAVRKRKALAVWPSRVPAATVGEAAVRGVPLARIEDGFLRSRGLGAGLHPPGSVVIDRTGIYYNARAASDLETLLDTHAFPAALVERARDLRQRIRAAGVTKYGRESGTMLGLPTGRRTVLAVGQVDDDLSVRLGSAGVGGNLDFLMRVRRCEPDAWIIYRPHPDVQAGHRRGHLPDATVLEHADHIDAGAPLMALVAAVDEVHVLSSLTGFEALMRDRPVTVHGMPFYAGWGLTNDLGQPTGRRTRQLTMDQLVAGALILYPHYLDPVTGLPCGPELMVERMVSGAPPSMTWLIRARALQGKLRRFMTLSAEFLRG